MSVTIIRSFMGLPSVLRNVLEAKVVSFPRLGWVGKVGYEGRNSGNDRDQSSHCLWKWSQDSL